MAQGHLHAGWGCGGDSGPISPHWAVAEGRPPRPAWEERGEGACPTLGLDLGEHCDFLLYRGVWGAGKTPVAQGKVVKRAPGDAPCPGVGASSLRVGQGDSEATLSHPVQSRQRGRAGWDLEGKCPLDLHPSRYKLVL